MTGPFSTWQEIERPLAKRRKDGRSQLIEIISKIVDNKKCISRERNSSANNVFVFKKEDVLLIRHFILIQSSKEKVEKVTRHYKKDFFCSAF